MTRKRADIAVDKIRIPDDVLRAVDWDWVDALATMIAEEGQVQPIEVAAEGEGLNYVLDFGLHRLMAVRKLKSGTIDAVIDEAGGDPIARRRRAIHENLGRRELSVLDRAIHIAAWKELYEEENPGTKHGGERRKGQVAKFGDLVTQRFTASAAELLGISERGIQRAVRIAEGISRECRHRLATTRFANSQADLELLAQHAEPRQFQIVDLLLRDEDPASSVVNAMAILDGEPQMPAEERKFAAICGSFSRLPTRTRDRFFETYEREFLDWRQRNGRK